MPRWKPAMHCMEARRAIMRAVSLSRRCLLLDAAARPLAGRRRRRAAGERRRGASSMGGRRLSSVRFDPTTSARHARPQPRRRPTNRSLSSSNPRSPGRSRTANQPCDEIERRRRQAPQGGGDVRRRPKADSNAYSTGQVLRTVCNGRCRGMYRHFQSRTSTRIPQRRKKSVSTMMRILAKKVKLRKTDQINRWIDIF